MDTRPDLVGLLVDLAVGDVDFVVCGGVACVLHGVERVTMDLDLCLPEDEPNFRRFVDLLEIRGMLPRIPEPMGSLCDPNRRLAWRREKNAVAWTVQSPDGIEQIDVLLSYPIPWRDLAEDAWPVLLRGRLIRVTSRAHLIQAKRAIVPPRKKDLRDIEDLETLP